MKYTTINIQGNLLSEEILQKVETAEAAGQQATHFGLEPGANLRSEIEYAWSRIKLDWKHFSEKSQSLPANDPYGTTLTRRWMEQFFSSLGFTLTRQRSNLMGENKQGYAISHTADNADELPVHIVGFFEPDKPDKNTLDIKTSGGTSRLSPHATVQEYLNVTEHLFGMAANGLCLRLIRDSGRLIKLTYLEFDLKRMLDEDKYSEFTLLYRLLHVSRFPHNKAEADQCWLERYYQDSIETGNRIRDGLSQAVKESLLALGNGFLQHEHNTALREKIQSGKLSSKDYYRQLLRIIYRFLFLMVTEERDLVYEPEDKSETTQRLKKIYLQFYSIARLRKLSESRYVFESQYNDLWKGLVQTFQLFEAGSNGKKLGILPLAGDLFSYNAIKDLQDCLISNRLLLECVRNMNEFRDENKNLVHINYRSLDVEELGSVYEGLLELHPVIENIESRNPAHINFTFHEGTDRKTTGSYYTRPELVHELIKSALIPVIEDRLKETERIANGEWQLVCGERGTESALHINLKNLMINLSIEYEKLSGITNLAKRDRFSGDNLPIDKLLSQRRIVWDDFSTPKSRKLGSGQHIRGMGQEQQQGVQKFSQDSQWEFEGTGNTFDTGRKSKLVQPEANSALAGNFGDTGQTDTFFSKIHLSEKNLKLIWKLLPATIRHSLLASHHLLKLKVCDAAAGSGHMILAAARTIAWYLARVESGEDNPAPSVYRRCLREVIQHCIYAVDYNPDAVELCKLALWLEGHNSGKPLSFLDHKIRNGNSLVGVTDLNVLKKPLPDEAFNPVTGDNKEVCKELKKRNAAFRKTKQTDLFSAQGQQIKKDTEALKSAFTEMESIQQDSVEAVQQVKKQFEKVRESVFHEEKACHIWTAAFFKTYTDADDPTNPSSEKLAQYFYAPTQYGRLVGDSTRLAIEHKFFHWPLEFPDVFEQGGFDVMLGNPPWERIKLQQQEFFATRNTAIANAPNAAARNRLINALPQTNPELYNEYETAVHTADATGKFLRESGRCQLTAVGDINTYSIFSELTVSLVNKKGRTGIIVPTGIATDDSNKAFFGYMVDQNRLISLFDFENKEAIFQAVHRSYKFCLLTLAGFDIGKQKARFGFFLTRVEHLQDDLRIFSLSKEDFLRLNPNTKTCPVFRTRIDAELTTKIYQRVPVLINEETGENPWGVSFMRMFDVTNDAKLYKTESELNKENFVRFGPDFVKGGLIYQPFYEGKMAWIFDHHFSFYGSMGEEIAEVEYKDPELSIVSKYYINKNEKLRRLKNKSWKYKWFIGLRRVTNNTNERMLVSAITPMNPIANSWYLTFLNGGSIHSSYLIGLFCSMPFDYFARNSTGQPSLTYSVLYQLPVNSPQLIEPGIVMTILLRVIELTYSAWDIKAFADDVWKEAGESEELKVKSEKFGELSPLQAAIVKQWEENEAATGGHTWSPPEWCEIDPQGCPLPPFKWDEERRAVLKAELDAIYAKLYGLTTEELRYILDPQDVYGPDFPGETFRVLKEKEIRQYGEYRTRRLVLEAWEKLNA